MKDREQGGKPVACILIIEDEPDMAMGLRDNLQFEGYQVAVAPDGEKGLSAALQIRPQLILLDVMLPGIDGFEVCRRLRARGIKSPVIMLTARGQRSTRSAGSRWVPTTTSRSPSACGSCSPGSGASCSMSGA